MLPWLRQIGLRRAVGLAGAAGVIATIALLSLGYLPSLPGDLRPLPPATSTVNRIALVGAQHRYLFVPVSGHVLTGVRYRYALTTQCGLADPVGPDFDGSFWDPMTQPLPVPPPGFKTPVDNGSMVLHSSDVAEFRSSAGTWVRFRRHQGSVIATLCG